MTSPCAKFLIKNCLYDKVCSCEESIIKLSLSEISKGSMQDETRSVK